MKTFFKFAFTASVALATALVFSCSGIFPEDKNKSSSSYGISGSGSSSNSVAYRYCRDIRYDSNRLGCCGVTLYLLETQGCEGNDLVKEKCNDGINLCTAPARETYAKCGDAWYGKATLGCCGYTVYELSSQFCANNYGYDVYNKCGGDTYDPSTKGCCSNKLYSLQGNGCYNGVVKTKCGGVFYDEYIRLDGGDYIKQDCCGGKVYEEYRSQNDVLQGCCSGTVYNYDFEYCSNNKVISYSSSSSYLSSSSSPSSSSGIASSSSRNIVYGADLTDARDNQTYKTVVIGTQTWMAENLNYEAEDSRCVGAQENCDIYGRDYDWTTSRNVCPSGWHLPNDTEWATLRHTVNPSCSLTDLIPSCSGASKLKSVDLWNNNGGGTDDFGFRALPGGSPPSSISGGIGSAGSWWSATGHYYWQMQYNSDGIFQTGYNTSEPSPFLSVRCIKD